MPLVFAQFPNQSPLLIMVRLPSLLGQGQKTVGLTTLSLNMFFFEHKRTHTTV